MTAVLVLAAFALGFGACGLAVYFLQSRNLPGPGQHTGPMLITAPALLTPPDGMPVAEQARFADAMHAASEPYLPVHERTVPRRQAGGHPPWTGSFPAVQDPGADEAADDEMAAEIRRMRFVRSQLPQDPGNVTRAEMERALAGLRALPVYGEASVATVLEAERLNRVMRP